MLHHRQRKANRGFTLLELLVVIVIIAVLSGVASLSIRSDAKQKLNEEATRLSALIGLASQEAILNAQELALEIEANGYSFLMQDEEGGWIPVEESGALRPRELPESMRLSVVIEGLLPDEDEDDEEAGPQRVWILSSGEMSPFTIDIRLEEGAGYTLEGDIMGGLQLTPPENPS